MKDSESVGKKLKYAAAVEKLSGGKSKNNKKFLMAAAQIKSNSQRVSAFGSPPSYTMDSQTKDNTAKFASNEK